MKRKGIRKFLSMLFALVMIASCFTTIQEAKADGETGSITNVASANHTFSAYQIFSGSVDDSTNTIGNIVWGSGVVSEDTQVNDKTIYQALAAIEVTISGTATKVFTSDGSAALTSAAEVAEVLEKYVDNSDVYQAFADAIADYLTDTATATSGTAEQETGESTYKYTISSLPIGYYLVQDTGTLASGDARTAYILRVVGAAEVDTKEVAPSVQKTIVETDDTGSTSDVTATSASAGEKVTFKLVGYVPSELSSYSSYTFTFNDTLSKNLTYDTGSIEVSYSGSNVASDSSGTIEAYDSTTNPNGYTLNTETNTGTGITTMTIAINGVSETKYQGATITVTYTATLSSEAFAGTAETNTVKLTYSSNPANAGETNSTEEQTVYVYTYNLNVTKTKENGTDALTGAGFTLYKKTTVTAGTYNSGSGLYTYTSGDTSMTAATGSYDVNTTYYVQVGSEVSANSGNSSNVASFEDLGEGTYILVESTTPNGYNTIEAICFNIVAEYNTDGTVKTLKATDSSGTDSSTITADTSNATTTLVTTVANSAGSTLPETGGIGTTIFYIIGSILVLGAAILLITKRLVKKEDSE